MHHHKKHHKVIAAILVGGFTTLITVVIVHPANTSVNRATPTAMSVPRRRAESDSKALRTATHTIVPATAPMATQTASQPYTTNLIEGVPCRSQTTN